MKTSLLKVVLFFTPILLMGGCDSGPSVGPDHDADVEFSDADHGDTSVYDGDQESDGDTDFATVELEWTDCNLATWPYGYPPPPPEVQCALIDVPLDYRSPQSETLQLTIARHPSIRSPGEQAVFNLAGGPGGTSVGESGLLPDIVPSLFTDFDFVYVDQRGTGDSGALACSNNPDTVEDWQACASQLSLTDLNRYVTLAAAHDLDIVRRALGYEEINFIATSYGTRLALEYMRQYGEHVKAVVLGGVLPPDIDMFGVGLTLFDQGIDKLVMDCEASEECSQITDDLRRDLESRRQLLRETPRRLEATSYGIFIEDEQAFLEILLSALSESWYRFDIPRAIHEAVNGENTRWNDLMSSILGVQVTDETPSGRTVPPLNRISDLLSPTYFGPAMSLGLQQTIMCGEFYPNATGLDQIIAEVVWNHELYSTRTEVCDFWNVDPIDPTLRTPVSSSVATLLITGENDINTPPQWGSHANEGLSNGNNVVVPYLTHNSIWWNRCPTSIMADFIQSEGIFDDVDRSCIELMPHPGW